MILHSKIKKRCKTKKLKNLDKSLALLNFGMCLARALSKVLFAFIPSRSLLVADFIHAAPTFPSSCWPVALEDRKEDHLFSRQGIGPLHQPYVATNVVKTNCA